MCNCLRLFFYAFKLIKNNIHFLLHSPRNEHWKNTFKDYLVSEHFQVSQHLLYTKSTSRHAVCCLHWLSEWMRTSGGKHIIPSTVLMYTFEILVLNLNISILCNFILHHIYCTFYCTTFGISTVTEVKDLNNSSTTAAHHTGFKSTTPSVETLYKR